MRCWYFFPFSLLELKCERNSLLESFIAAQEWWVHGSGHCACYSSAAGQDFVGMLLSLNSSWPGLQPCRRNWWERCRGFGSITLCFSYKTCVLCQVYMCIALGETECLQKEGHYPGLLEVASWWLILYCVFPSMLEEGLIAHLELVCSKPSSLGWSCCHLNANSIWSNFLISR